MKRFVLLLSILFCNVVIAETTDLQFVVDNETYATKTCTIGGGVELPTEPTKYGYDFDGWQPVFYRGTFATWNNIPTNTNGYLANTNGSYIPQENDYIIVNDASGVPEYGENIKIEVYDTVRFSSSWGEHGGYCHSFIDYIDYGCSGTIGSGLLTITTRVQGNWITTWSSNQKEVLYNSQKYSIGTNFLSKQVGFESNGTYYAKIINGYPYSGKWLLRYHGNWNDFKRGGWVAEKQLD